MPAKLSTWPGRRLLFLTRTGGGGGLGRKRHGRANRKSIIHSNKSGGSHVHTRAGLLLSPTKGGLSAGEAQEGRPSPESTNNQARHGLPWPAGRRESRFTNAFDRHRELIRCPPRPAPPPPLANRAANLERHPCRETRAGPGRELRPGLAGPRGSGRLESRGGPPSPRCAPRSPGDSRPRAKASGQGQRATDFRCLTKELSCREAPKTGRRGLDSPPAARVSPKSSGQARRAAHGCPAAAPTCLCLPPLVGGRGRERAPRPPARSAGPQRRRSAGSHRRLPGGRGSPLAASTRPAPASARGRPPPATGRGRPLRDPWRPRPGRAGGAPRTQPLGRVPGPSEQRPLPAAAATSASSRAVRKSGPLGPPPAMRSRPGPARSSAPSRSPQPHWPAAPKGTRPACAPAAAEPGTFGPASPAGGPVLGGGRPKGAAGSAAPMPQGPGSGPVARSRRSSPARPPGGRRTNVSSPSGTAAQCAGLPGKGVVAYRAQSSWGGLVPESSPRPQQQPAALAAPD